MTHGIRSSYLQCVREILCPVFCSVHCGTRRENVWNVSQDRYMSSVIFCEIIKLQNLWRYIVIAYCFTSRSIIFHWHGWVTIVGEEHNVIGVCSALITYEQGAVLCELHLCYDTGPRFYCLTQRVAPFKISKGILMTYSILHPQGIAFLQNFFQNNIKLLITQ